MKKSITVLTATLLLSVTALTASAASVPHTVEKGDTMWKLAATYQVGTQEIINANPQISNPNLIYPGQLLSIPQIDGAVISYEEQVVKLVNQYRAQYDLAPLSMNWELSRVARIKSQDMVDNNYFSHNSPIYGSPFQMMKAFGIRYKTAGENIAYGQRTPEAVVKAWMNSSGHRANILNANYKQIGVGYAADGHYWTQMFIG